MSERASLLADVLEPEARLEAAEHLQARAAERVEVVRVPVRVLEPEERLHHPEVVVERGYSEEEALREASRCLDCGVTPVFDGTRCVLCGGCADVCPTQCLKLVSLLDLVRTPDLDTAAALALGAPGEDCGDASVILKDEDRCIRCALCAMRCPTDAISMERVAFQTTWRSS